MRAMLMRKAGQPLEPSEIDRPAPAADQALIRVKACAVCRTDLHVLDGDLKNPKLPLVPGHEIVGRIEAVGEAVTDLRKGDRVGVPWLGWTCGHCRYCSNGRENLCGEARFTGYDFDGGYAEYAVADQRYCLPIPEAYDDVEAAPLLCAGLIGQRSLAMTGQAQRLGIYGFGAAAHIVAQVAVYEGRTLYAFTRPGDQKAQRFARRLGAVWSGGSDETPPQQLDAAIIFAPVGELVPQALRSVARGGKVVCGGIHMSDIPAFPYEILWGERSICSVANLTRQDSIDFMQVAPQVPVKTETRLYRLEDANDALEDLRHGRLEGAAVLWIA